MHPRSPYALRKPDFAALARADASFARLVKTRPNGEAQLDWRDPSALVELCRVLLHHDFGVRWTLPARALCPTVPSRLNYLLWIADLIALGPSIPTVQIVGIDIGTGASCIYPLLGVAHLGWKFLATEADPISVNAARHNVDLNNWSERIEVRQVVAPEAEAAAAAPEATAAVEAADGVVADDDADAAEYAELRQKDNGGGASSNAPILVDVLLPSDGAFTFCMCNPPWFGGGEEPMANKSIRGPDERCTATASEVFTDGGEAGFIGRLAADSAKLRQRVRWYSSLVGRKASLHRALKAVKACGAIHVRTTEISQGVTSRWAIAWSFCADAAPAMVPPSKPAVKAFVPPQGLGRDEIFARVRECLQTHTAITLEASEERQEDLIARGRHVLSAGDEEEEVGSARKQPRTEEVVAPTTDNGAPPPEFLFEVSLAGDEVRVELVATTRGAASSAFWRLAEELRNDVVRDTRKWRRRMASSARTD